jgi:hypothetical protein
MGVEDAAKPSARIALRPASPPFHLERDNQPGDDHFRDVRILAGHAPLSTTQRYIEADVEAQRKVVDLIYRS